MLWASGGGGAGYPGVTSNGEGGLNVAGPINAPSLTLDPSGGLVVNNAHGGTLLAILDGLFNQGLSLTEAVGLFGHDPPEFPTTGGAHTAGGTYTAVEQAMLEACYTALQSIGLVT